MYVCVGVCVLRCECALECVYMHVCMYTCAHDHRERDMNTPSLHMHISTVGRLQHWVQRRLGGADREESGTEADPAEKDL